MNRNVLALLIAGAVLLLDQITKAWAVAAFEGEPYDLIEGFLRLSIVRNPGASYSTFQGGGQIIGLIAVGAAVLVMVMVPRVPSRFEVVALGFILGGTLGNLADRIARGDGFLDGAVVDWIDFSFFPSFNVADSALTIGVGLLLIGTLLRHDRE